MRHATGPIVGMLAVAILSGGALAQSPTTAPASPALLLEKGIYTEEALGDLDAAIVIYRQVAEQARTDRAHAAQAQFRLGVCLQKTKRAGEAIEAFRTLQADFADQKALAARAARKIVDLRQNLSDAELAAIVAGVVKDISTMAETDLRIPPLLQSLRELPEPRVVKEVGKHLDSPRNTVRWAAIYVLWKGGFADASSTVPALIELCAHSEDMTRGMAALALGGLKAQAGFDKIMDMGLNDKSDVARRCAVYALGLMGRPEAKAALDKALKDPNPMVRNNAEAALTMLEKAAARTGGQMRLPAEVKAHVVRMHRKTVREGQEKGVGVNGLIFGVDDEFNWHCGGLILYQNLSNQEALPPIHVGNFSSVPSFVLTDEDGVEQQYVVRENADAGRGKYSLLWKPSTPVPPGAVRLFEYMNDQTKELPRTEGRAKLTMQNHFGPPVLESFFLVLPNNVTVASSTRPFDSKTTIGTFTIYLWQRSVPADTTNHVDVTLERTRPTSGPAAGRATRPAPSWIAPASTGDQVAVEDLALAMLAAVRDKDDDALKALATDRTKGWRDALPALALELRERFRQMTGKPFDMQVAQSFVSGDLAAVKCTGGKELNGAYLVLFFVKTEAGWKNFSLRNSPPSVSLETHLGNAAKETGVPPASGPATRPSPAVTQAAEGWLGMVDQEQYDKGWEQAAGLLQRAIAKDKFAEAMRAARGPLGPVVGRKLLSAVPAASLPGAPDGEYVVIQYETEFKNKKQAIETITPMKDKDGAWRVSGYYIK
ncbi:MAG: DUF4019 domain-containing protein [Planctomycetota bacterium]